MAYQITTASQNENRHLQKVAISVRLRLSAGLCVRLARALHIEKTPKTLILKTFGGVFGVAKRIRTSDLPLRRRSLYPAEL